jgi:hypothetical protein
MTDFDRMRDCLTHVGRAWAERTGRPCLIYQTPVYWTLRDADEDQPWGSILVERIEPRGEGSDVGAMKKLRTMRDLGQHVPKVPESHRDDSQERRAEHALSENKPPEPAKLPARPDDEPPPGFLF